jgi:hypothetical protein
VRPARIASQYLGMDAVLIQRKHAEVRPAQTLDLFVAATPCVHPATPATPMAETLAARPMRSHAREHVSFAKSSAIRILTLDRLSLRNLMRFGWAVSASNLKHKDIHLNIHPNAHEYLGCGVTNHECRRMSGPKTADSACQL